MAVDPKAQCAASRILPATMRLGTSGFTCCWTKAASRLPSDAVLECAQNRAVIAELQTARDAVSWPPWPSTPMTTSLQQRVEVSVGIVIRPQICKLRSASELSADSMSPRRYLLDSVATHNGCSLRTPCGKLRPLRRSLTLAGLSASAGGRSLRVSSDSFGPSTCGTATHQPWKFDGRTSFSFTTAVHETTMGATAQPCKRMDASVLFNEESHRVCHESFGMSS